MCLRRRRGRMPRRGQGNSPAFARGPPADAAKKRTVNAGASRTTGPARACRGAARAEPRCDSVSVYDGERYYSTYRRTEFRDRPIRGRTSVAAESRSRRPPGATARPPRHATGPRRAGKTAAATPGRIAASSRTRWSRCGPRSGSLASFAIARERRGGDVQPDEPCDQDPDAELPHHGFERRQRAPHAIAGNDVAHA